MYSVQDLLALPVHEGGMSIFGLLALLFLAGISARRTNLLKALSGIRNRALQFTPVRAILALVLAAPMFAQEHRRGGEASLVLPDLDQAVFIGGLGGRTLLGIGMLISILGLLFGLIIYKQLRGLPVHESMREVSELIYETCKTYLLTQGRFLMILEIFIGIIIIF
ncbi:MAG: hypothetical protein KJZ78_06780, partial [Bryobacteraceae bacterium]|nr:hypothetical protein [Bryobacteraceae bacterium]